MRQVDEAAVLEAMKAPAALIRTQQGSKLGFRQVIDRCREVDEVGLDGETEDDLWTTRRDERVESGRRKQGPERAKLVDTRREYACDVGVVRYAQTVPGIA